MQSDTEDSFKKAVLYQEEIMKKVMETPNIEANWDSEEVEQKILEFI